MTKRHLVAGAFVLTWGLTGCIWTSGGGNSSDQREGVATSATTEQSSGNPQGSEPAENYPTFGETWTSEHGLSVTVSAPEAYNPSETRMTEFDDAVVFDVTLANDTGGEYDPALLTLTANSGGQEADTVFNLRDGIKGKPSTTILDGQSVSFQHAFGVAESSDITVEIRSFSGHRSSVIFVNQ